MFSIRGKHGAIHETVQDLQKQNLLRASRPPNRRPVPLRFASSPAAGKPQLPVDFEDATWSKLREAVQAVHGKRPVSVSLEELYRVRSALQS